MHIPRDPTTGRAWSRILALSLAVTSVAAVAAAPAGAVPSVPTTVPAAAGDDPTDKFTTAVLEQLEENKSADFWIELAPEADLAPARDLADWAERGQYVYDELTATARESQAAIVAQLDAAGVSYETFWIGNTILVEDGSLDLARKVAAASSVEGIHQQVTLERSEPVKSGPTDRGRRSAAVEWGISEINAPEVWAQGFTGQGITVASFDTGVDRAHPALAGHYRGRGPEGTFDDDYNWLDLLGECSNGPCDTYGHGTHTTGTMVGDDGAGNQVGVAPGATWIGSGCLETCSWDKFLDIAEWMLAPTRTDGTDPDPAMRPHIVNNSWGVPPSLEDEVGPDFMAEETAAWEAAGIFGVFAAGNEGALGCQSGRMPGRFAHTYAVGAYDSSGDIAYFSARGPGTDGAVKPDIAAPGVDVRSSVPGGQYQYSDGTSMAAPHVAGAVALLWSAVPSLVGDVETTRALLDSTAIDTSDDQCGGTAANNNVWGEGTLDIAATIAAAAEYKDGTVAGTVADASGAPVVGAQVLIDGEQDRTLVTDADGAFSVVVPVGDYAVSASAYGYLASSPTHVTVEADGSVSVGITLDAAPTRSVTGTVVHSGSGDPVPGAPVTLVGTPFEPVTTGDDGTFSFADVPEGSYTLTVEMDRCSASYSDGLVVDGDENVAVEIVARSDGGGYSCVAGMGQVYSGDTKLSLSGDTASTRVDLPFDFPFYEKPYTRAFVSTDGHVNFLGSVDQYGNAPIPYAVEPNAALFPFWDDLVVPADGGVYSGTTTVDGVEGLVLEWRNVQRYNEPDSRIFFSVVLLANGDVIYTYGPGIGSDDARGASATIGIENAEGSDGLQYSYEEAVTTAGWTIRFDAPALAAVSGVVKDYNTKEPVAKATVSLTAADGSTTSVTTATDGSYHALERLGRYAVSFSKKDFESVAKSVDLTTEGETASTNAQLKAAQLTVSKTSVTATKVLGAAPVTRTFTVTNSGSAAADVDLGTGREGFVMQGGGSAAGVITHVEGAATEVTAAPAERTTAAGDWSTASGGASAGSGWTSSGTAANPSVPVAAAGETTLTHSSSHEIVQDHAIACNGGGTKYLRTFTLADFGVDADFSVSSLSVGIETVETPVTAEVNLYTLDGGELTYANLTKVGGTTVSLTDENLEILRVPVTGTVPAGGTLVVEVGSAGGGLYLGTNSASETSPTYVVAAPCGSPEPRDFATIGFPDVNWVLDVVGTEGGPGAAWLDVQPSEPVTLAPGQSVQVVATLDPRLVDQPGTWTADVVVAAATPYTEPSVAASLVVTPPTSWGKIAGKVTDTAGTALQGALVSIDGLEKDVTLVTGADGTYAYWMGVSNNSLQLVAAKDGYVPQVRTAKIIKGQTVTHNFALKKL
jgi:subtilisin family serine protease